MRRAALIYLSFFVFLGLLHSPAQARKPATDIAPGKAASTLPRSVGIQGAQALIASQADLLVLDVRTGWEFDRGHLEGALTIPVQELGLRLGALVAYRDRPVLIYCRTQNRSAVAHDYLAGQGFNSTYMVGGFSSWQRRGLPSKR